MFRLRYTWMSPGWRRLRTFSNLNKFTSWPFIKVRFGLKNQTLPEIFEKVIKYFKIKKSRNSCGQSKGTFDDDNYAELSQGESNTSFQLLARITHYVCTQWIFSTLLILLQTVAHKDNGKSMSSLEWLRRLPRNFNFFLGNSCPITFCWPI